MTDKQYYCKYYYAIEKSNNCEKMCLYLKIDGSNVLIPVETTHRKVCESESNSDPRGGGVLALCSMENL